MTIDRLDELGGCSCHIAQPCGFCEELNELENDARAAGGMAGLRTFIQLRDGEGPFHLIADTETTGLPKDYRDHTHPDTPHLVELAGLLAHDNGTLVNQLHFIIKPDGYEIPIEASNIHGITQERAMKEGVPLWFALWKFERLVTRAKSLVFHNHSFDRLILRGGHHRLGLSHRFRGAQRVCTMVASTQHCAIPKPNGRGGYKWPTLTEATKHYFGEDLQDAHSAMADAMACKRIFFHMKANNLLPTA